jgi:predicted nucleic acid-binding protein
MAAIHYTNEARIRYTIEARIVDISTDTPNSTDCFLVDTNVWFWMTYANAGYNELQRERLANTMSIYADYINAAYRANAKLCWCGLSLAELAHQIEKTEREIYESAVRSISPKEYRHNLPDERSRIVSEIQAAWEQIKSLAAPLKVTIDSQTTDVCLAYLQNEKVDGYDIFILEAMKNNGVVQIITDDGDFATVSGIQVFTANRNVINTARTQGKLQARRV